MTFADKLRELGYRVRSYFDELIDGEILEIDGQVYLYKDIPQTKYSGLMKAYLMSNKK
ncbi:hypothetical protein P8831_25835 [Priestia megaterium]|uniref:hypothetical protein n=1 Tax=Priestia megaterium TaxID=1404 RepID=UPI002D7EB098|nr:hypothetical protein [Priestia megaterium]MEB4872105.1 hypothetical protein [Priestia megaterium]